MQGTGTKRNRKYGPQRTEFVAFKVTLEERERIRGLARERLLSVSEVVRDAVLSEARRQGEQRGG